MMILLDFLVTVSVDFHSSIDCIININLAVTVVIAIVFVSISSDNIITVDILVYIC